MVTVFVCILPPTHPLKTGGPLTTESVIKVGSRLLECRERKKMQNIPPAPVRLRSSGLLRRAGSVPSFSILEIDGMARKHDARQLLIDLEDKQWPLLHSWVYLMPTAEDFDSQVLRSLQIRTFRDFGGPGMTRE